MSDHPFVSIVILNYNGLSFLKKTIPAIIGLSYTNREIIVVDNNSCDESIQYLKAVPNVAIIENSENVGYSKGKNIGVAHAKGEYVFLLDNDILIGNKNILQDLLQIYRKAERPAFLCPCLEDYGKEKTIYYKGEFGYFGIKSNKPILLETIIHSQQDYYQTQLVFGGNLFFKRNIWNELGGLDDLLPFNLDDNDLSTTAALYGYICYMANTQPMNVHLGSKNRVNNDQFYWGLKYLLAGHLISYAKHLQWTTFFIVSIVEVTKISLKSIKNTIFRKDLRMLIAPLYSIGLFFRLLPKTIERRRRIQQNRKITDREFFNRETTAQFL